MCGGNEQFAGSVQSRNDVGRVHCDGCLGQSVHCDHDRNGEGESCLRPDDKENFNEYSLNDDPIHTESEINDVASAMSEIARRHEAQLRKLAQFRIPATPSLVHVVRRSREAAAELANNRRESLA